MIITDEFMHEMISRAKAYSVVILKATATPPGPEVMKVI